jgi:hypothetical protein
MIAEQELGVKHANELLNVIHTIAKWKACRENDGSMSTERSFKHVQLRPASAGTVGEPSLERIKPLACMNLIDPWATRSPTDVDRDGLKGRTSRAMMVDTLTARLNGARRMFCMMECLKDTWSYIDAGIDRSSAVVASRPVTSTDSKMRQVQKVCPSKRYRSTVRASLGVFPWYGISLK